LTGGVCIATGTIPLFSISVSVDSKWVRLERLPSGKDCGASTCSCFARLFSRWFFSSSGYGPIVSLMVIWFYFQHFMCPFLRGICIFHSQAQQCLAWVNYQHSMFSLVRGICVFAFAGTAHPCGDWNYGTTPSAMLVPAPSGTDCGAFNLHVCFQRVSTCVTCVCFPAPPSSNLC
jgi:hypothetical protein